MKPAAPYLRIKEYLKHALAEGRWPPGTLMPSEAELVNQFGVSRMTVNRALRELQMEGALERLQGVGTFAARPDRASSSLTIRDVREQIAERGRVHRAVVHLVREETVGAELAARFGLAEGEPVFHSQIVHEEDGVPLQYEDRFVNPRCAPGYLDVDFTTTTPTHYLLEVAPAWEARYTVEAQQPSAREAKLLQIPAATPCLVVARVTSHQDVPITFARLVHPGTRYRLEGQFHP
jgi:GntR family histidine utilization transcriptional repressor